MFRGGKNRRFDVPAILVAMVVGAICLGPVDGLQAASCTSSWELISSPNRGTEGSDLEDVDALSGDDAWAVGYSIASGNERTLVEHWNGTIWKIVSSPNVATSRNHLLGVSALSKKDVWAVGYSGTQTHQRALIEHWNGAKWKVVPSPKASDKFSILNSVFGISAANVWAIGNYEDARTNSANLAERWNGTAWKIVKMPTLNQRFTTLDVITAAPKGRLWALGGYEYPGPNGSLPQAFRRDPSKWQHLKTPRQGDDSYFNGATAVSNDDVWAVGSWDYHPFVEHWDGSSWTIVPTENEQTTQGVFNGAAASNPSRVWAVGYQSTNVPATALIELWDGNTWTVAASPQPGSESFLQSVSARTSGEAWAVGQYFDGSSAPNGGTLIEHFC